MNKDAILATIIGFIIGLFITGILLVGPSLASLLPKINFKLPTFSFGQTKTTPTPAQKDLQFSVTIDSPLPESIETENEILVSGTTAPDSTVLIEGNTTEAITQVKADGKYAGKITLIEGKNDITVTSYLKDKNAAQTVTVFYTPEEF
jgi:hypothetical protein